MAACAKSWRRESQSARLASRRGEASRHRLGEVSMTEPVYCPGRWTLFMVTINDKYNPPGAAPLAVL
jgi:hypothetical protein